MPTNDIPLIASIALNAGLIIREVVRAYTSIKNTKQQNDSSVMLADQQITASEKSELKGQVNRLLEVWQQSVIESNERESQVKIQAYIIEDLNKKLNESHERIIYLNTEIAARKFVKEAIETIEAKVIEAIDETETSDDT